MRIRKYDVDYGRRKMMAGLAAGVGAGVFMPLQKVFAGEMDIGKAYPDELLSIEAQTKGKLKVGDVISKDNLEHVKHLLDPCVIQQVEADGRTIRIGEPERDIRNMYPHTAYEKTLENLAAGKRAKFDADGNVVQPNGEPWGAGVPFPGPQNALEMQANMAMSWGRADANLYAVREHDYAGDGTLEYQYDFAWVELQCRARSDNKPFLDLGDYIRLQSVFFATPDDVRGTSFLSEWYYDQRKIPALYGYLPQFRRVRQFPAGQRFEPLIPGATWFLTDPWAAGDPMLTWGNYEVIERKPMLGAWNGNFIQKNDNWELPRLKGNEKYFDVEFTLSPEVWVLKSEPTGYPRAPVSYRLAYVDARNCTYTGCIRYDRQGKPWVNFESAFSQYKHGDRVEIGHDGKYPAWSWTYVMSYNMQNGRMSLIDHAKTVSGGIKSQFQIDQEWMYKKYMTQGALQTLGRV